MMPDIPGHREYSLQRWRPLAVKDLIRVGRPNDGGYVVSQRCVDETSVLVSFGVSDDWSFEAAFLDLNGGASLVALDGSVSSRAFAARGVSSLQRALLRLAQLRPSRSLAELSAAQRDIRTAFGLRRFFDGERRRFYSRYLSDRSGAWATTWPELRGSDPQLASAGRGGIFVKMDIEGSEYRVLSDVLQDADDFSGLVVEFHDCDVHWDCFVALMDELVKRFAVVHVHGNNFMPTIRNSSLPRALEITFAPLRFVDGQETTSPSKYPVPGLDMPCDPTRPDYPIEF